MAERQFISNEGRGPYRAKLLRVSGGYAHLLRWKPGGKRKTTFTIPAWFLSSPTCGWAEIAGPANEPLNQPDGTGTMESGVAALHSMSPERES